VWQREQVETLIRERHLQRIRGQRSARVECQRETKRDPVGTQEIDVRQPGLRGAKAEHVLGCAVELRLFPVENIAPEVAGKPFGERAARAVIFVRALGYERLAIHALDRSATCVEGQVLLAAILATQHLSRSWRLLWRSNAPSRRYTVRYTARRVAR
jgi:hypothetical protein